MPLPLPSTDRPTAALDSVAKIDLASMTTEGNNPLSSRLDELSAMEIAALMNQQDAVVVAAVNQIVPQIARGIEAVATALRAGGRLIYTGAGTSGRLGVLDASECPPTFGTDASMIVGLIAGGRDALTRAIEGAEDSGQQGQDDLQGLAIDARDVVVGIATSGRTPYVIGGLRYAQQVGCVRMGIACNTGSEMEPLVDIMMTPVVGPEVVSGSTRLKAGTATKMILNMLTTGAMVRIGKTYGNWMVDLKATNLKLTARSIRMVGRLTGLPPADAASLIEACGGEVKTALASHTLGIDAAQARSQLARHGGRLKSLLSAHGKSLVADPS